MIDDTLSAITSAWIATVAATSLLFVALAIASIWDSSAYLHALGDSLSRLDSF